jgi:hypothetical protein
MFVETEAPLEVGTRVLWGDETTGKVVGTVARVTLEGCGIIFRSGQSATLHVLKELTDGLLAPEGDPEVRKDPKQKGKLKKGGGRKPTKQKGKLKKGGGRKPTKQKRKPKKKN